MPSMTSTEKKVLDLYQAGEPVHRINVPGITNYRVRRILQKWDYGRNERGDGRGSGRHSPASMAAYERQRISTERLARISELYNAGWTYQKIGDDLGITRERVRQLIVKYHITDDTRARINATAAARAEKLARMFCKICEREIDLRDTGRTYRDHCLAVHPVRRSGHGKPRAMTKPPSARYIEVAKFYVEHPEMTTAQIAAKFNITHQETIYAMLKRVGVEPDRGGGHYPRLRRGD